MRNYLKYEITPKDVKIIFSELYMKTQTILKNDRFKYTKRVDMSKYNELNSLLR
jgi:hypothetical protein